MLLLSAIIRDKRLISRRVCAGDFAERILIGGIECCYAKGVFSLAHGWRRTGEC